MAVTRKSAGGDLATSSVSRRGRRQRWSQGAKRTAPVQRTSNNPPGLVGAHWLANRALLMSLLIPTVLCVLELQVRLNVSRTYTALQDARTMQQLLMDSRAQLMAALGTVDASGQREQGGLATRRDLEPLLLPPPPSRQLAHPSPFRRPARWIKAGPMLRGY
ncbi:MAG: hypothetical protein TQ37_04650 [Candidatus Synechococcus spongiarum 15L]|uniref:Uncharacterized protein n=3 Tax=Candidatus Synechococcus spongiarum TaxID=431041 RepID=A0A1T1D239_9SYNE|nr:MAG: hypothetical protein TQ37_04650 [Candidatus Synechococcus spongiarum 15L]OOV34912.1 hypothetical protein BV61_01805 [Candidatus Synechococcus spongiarum LMB bulk15M]